MRKATMGCALVNTLAAAGVATVATSCYSPNRPVGDREDGSTSVDAGTTAGEASGSSAGASETPVDKTGTGPVADDTAGTVGESGVPSACGNGELESGELCDDGVNDGSYGGCEPDCSALAAHCGDGRAQQPELCDDGDDVNADGCNIDCVTSGRLMWSRTFEGSTATSVAVGDADDLVVATFLGAALRYSADGSPGWSSLYVYPNASDTLTTTVAYSVDDNAWFVAGQAEVLGQESNGWWRKLNGDALPLLTMAYDSPFHHADHVAAVSADTNGDFYVAGSTEDPDVINDSYLWLRKYSVDGDLLWVQTLDQSFDDVGRGVTVDGSGNVLLSGSVEVTEVSRYWWLRKFDSEGVSLWTRSGGGAASDAAMNVATGPNDVVAVCGTVAEDVWVRLYSPGGVEIWTRTFDGPALDPGPLSEIAYAVAIDSAGAVVAAGGYAEAVADGNAWVRKYTAEGDEAWTVTPMVDDDGSIQLARGVAIDSRDYVVVVGLDMVEGVNQGWVQQYSP
jgi:cysteine-rich repeat protein